MLDHGELASIIRLLLSRDASQRPSAAELLSHPALQPMVPPLGPSSVCSHRRLGSIQDAPGNEDSDQSNDDGSGSLPDDVASLRAVVLERDATIEQQRRTIVRLTALVSKLGKRLETAALHTEGS